MLFAFVIAYSIAFSPLDAISLYYDFFGNALLVIGGIYLIISLLFFFKEKRLKIEYEREISELGMSFSKNPYYKFSKLFFLAGIAVFIIGTIMSIYFYRYSITAPEIMR
jgi:hypothetical protein